MGIAQTVWEEYDLLKEELPGQRLRREKVLCGGHSLGGAITAFFAEWDFAGSPGYEQCAGYFALDSTISTSLRSLSGLPSGPAASDAGLGYDAVQAGLDSGAIPRDLSLPVLINPETENLLNSSSQPLAFLETSDGFFNGDGGAVVDKNFPLPSDLARQPSLQSLDGSLLGNGPARHPGYPGRPPVRLGELQPGRDARQSAVRGAAPGLHRVVFPRQAGHRHLPGGRTADRGQPEIPEGDHGQPDDQPARR